MKSHLTKFFTRHAEHHIAQSAHHVEMSEHYKSLAGMHKAKSDMGDKAAVYQAMSDAHRGMAEEHTEMGEASVACAKALMASRKAMGEDEDLEKLIPTNVSGITPDAPRAVLRFGQKEIPANSDFTFSKIFATDEEAS